jgi:hypothetical protein
VKYPASWLTTAWKGSPAEGMVTSRMLTIARDSVLIRG